MGKIAVCISGQVRNDDTALRKAAAALKDHDVDIFVSVWKKRGTKDFSGYNGRGQLSRVFGNAIAFAIPENWRFELSEVFADGEKIFQSLGDLSETAIRAYFPDARIEIEEEDIDLFFLTQTPTS